MSGLKALHPGKFALFGVLSVADLLLTLRLVHASGGQVYESNPLASAWLELYGGTGLAIFKGLALLLVAGVVLYIALHRPRAAGKILGFACVATGAVVVYSCFLVGLFGKAPHEAHRDEVRQAEMHGQHLDRAISQERAYAVLLDQLVQDLIANRCTLADAVERLAGSAKGQDPRWLDLLRKSYPDHTSAESMALHLGYHTLVQVYGNPEHQERVAERLEDEYQSSFGNAVNFHLSCAPNGGSDGLRAAFLSSPRAAARQ